MSYDNGTDEEDYLRDSDGQAYRLARRNLAQQVQGMRGGAQAERP